MPVKVGPRPKRSECTAVWQKVWHKWRNQAADWRAKVTAGMKRMRCPGGTSCGTRWKPLMRFVGFPEYILPTFAAIIMRESSGRTRALNSSSGAAGLLQFMPQWYRGQWGYPVFNPFDPEANLRAGVWLWRHEGLGPWSL